MVDTRRKDVCNGCLKRVCVLTNVLISIAIYAIEDKNKPRLKRQSRTYNNIHKIIHL